MIDTCDMTSSALTLLRVDINLTILFPQVEGTQIPKDHQEACQGITQEMISTASYILHITTVLLIKTQMQMAMAGE